MDGESRDERSQRRRSQIIAQIRAVPIGSVASYGAIARRAGWPRAARLVARILATHEGPPLPWHRIVRSDGRIAFPPGSPEFHEQCQRLRAEGVDVVAGRVRLDPAQSLLDQALWGSSPTGDVDRGDDGDDGAG